MSRLTELADLIYEECKKPAVLKTNMKMCARAALLKSLSKGVGTLRLRSDVARIAVDKLVDSSSYKGEEKTYLKMLLLKHIGELVGELKAELGEYATVNAIYTALLSKLLREIAD